MRLFVTARLVPLLALVALLVLAAQPVAAQSDKHSWDRIQTLPAGAKLAIKLKSGESIGGKVVSVTADTVTLTVKKKPLEVQRDAIKQIRKKSGGRTAAYAAGLAAAGLGAGYGIGYGIGEATNARFPTEIPTAIFGAAVGATVGTVLGSLGEVIYKAP